MRHSGLRFKRQPVPWLIWPFGHSWAPVSILRGLLSWPELDKVGSARAQSRHNPSGRVACITRGITNIFPLACVGIEEVGSYKCRYLIAPVQGNGRNHTSLRRCGFSDAHVGMLSKEEWRVESGSHPLRLQMLQKVTHYYIQSISGPEIATNQLLREESQGVRRTAPETALCASSAQWNAGCRLSSRFDINDRCRGQGVPRPLQAVLGVRISTNSRTGVP